MTFYLLSCLMSLSVFMRNIAATPTRTWSHHWTCSPDNHFRYNHCHDPIHLGDTFSAGSNVCNMDRNHKQNLRIVSYVLKDSIQSNMSYFETEVIQCAKQVQRLQQKNLTDIIGLEDVNNFSSENPFTNMYLKLSGFLRLYHKVWCLFGSKAVNECCLPFEQIFHSIKHRLLSKWWNVQEMCGETIGQQDCESRVPSFTNTDLTCEDTRNVIYILLRTARSLLVESQSVIDLL